MSSLARKSCVSTSQNGVLSAWERLAAAADYDARKLARVCNVSLHTLKNYFEDQGVSLDSWLQEAKLACAYRDVANGKPLRRLARQLGYRDFHSFNDAFAAEFGVAPAWLSPKLPTNGRAG